jgi:aminoglycoside phosphotransferase (APT) family kinase protein
VEASAALAVVEPRARLVREWELSGGISSRMTAVEAEWPDGSRRRLVVRVPFEGGRSISLEQEAALLTALAAAGLPVPEVLHVDGAWLALSYVEGVPAVAPADRAAAAVTLADLLVRIHATDPSTPEVAALPLRTPAVARHLQRQPETLDDSLQERAVRAALGAHWPPPEPLDTRLLHGDFWPGNVLWRDGAVAAVIDWEEACRGDPLADVGVSRLDILWAYGRDASDAFTASYVDATRADVRALPIWDLVAALRPAGYLSMWAADWPTLGRPDVTAATMRADHRWFTDRALAAIG